MKKLFICVSVAAALASCSNSDNNSVINPDTDNLIRLTGGVPSASVTPGTKAPIENGATFEAGVAGWESDQAADYSAAVKWESKASVKAGPTSQTITLNPTQVYDDAKTTYIKAYFPATGTLADGQVTFENLTGEIDAMLAPAVSGTKAAKITAPLAFTHRTTQLVFKVAGESGYAAGNTLTSITVKGAQLPTGFDLTQDIVTYAATADLPVPGISDPAIPVDANQAVTPIKVGNAVMLKPISGNKLTLDIETSEKKYTGVEATIDGDTDFAEGRAYTITLTFRKSGGVNLNATVAEWTTGTGAGNVD